MTIPSFAFRVDAGPTTGLGHLHRCTALAAALKQEGARGVFVVPDAAAIRHRIEVLGWDSEALTASGDTLGGTRDLEQVVSAVQRHGCRTVVVDSYHTTADYLAALRAQNLKVVVFDDLAREPLPAHIVINGGAPASAADYGSPLPDTVFLLGPRYAVLRPEFWNPPARVLGSSVRHLIVTLGGSAPDRWLADVLNSLESAGSDLDVTVVKGPFHCTEGEFPQSRRHRVRLLVDPPGIAGLIGNADLAICSGGQTVYELAAVGTPAVAVRTADNQARNLDAVVASGAARIAGAWGEYGVLACIASVVQELIEREDLRAAMSAAGQRLIDGQGARRVAHAVLAAQ